MYENSNLWIQRSMDFKKLFDEPMSFFFSELVSNIKYSYNIAQPKLLNLFKQFHSLSLISNN